LVLGEDLQLFAVYADKQQAFQIQNYMFNTDRQFVLTEDAMLDSIRTFRKYDLNPKDEAAEIFFALQAVLRLNKVNVFVYTNRHLLFTLQRLGFCLLYVKPGISRLAKGLSNSTAAAVTYEDGVAPVNVPLQNGEFLSDSDEIVSELVTRKVGLSWNTRGIENIERAARYGSGRQGVAVRSNWRWSTFEGIIACGDRGEVASELKWVNPVFCSIDFNLPPRLRDSHSKTDLLRLREYVSLRVHIHMPEMKMLEKQLLDLDGAKAVPFVTELTRARIVAAVSGQGKSYLVKAMLARGRKVIDGDLVSEWPTKHIIPGIGRILEREWWKDKVVDDIVTEHNKRLLMKAAEMHPGYVIYTYIPDIADDIVQLPVERHRELIATRSSDSWHPTLDAWDTSILPARDRFARVAAERGMKLLERFPVTPWDLRIRQETRLEDFFIFGDAWAAGCRRIKGLPDEWKRIAEDFGMVHDLSWDYDCEWRDGRIEVYKSTDYGGDWRNVYALAAAYAVRPIMVNYIPVGRASGFRAFRNGRYWMALSAKYQQHVIVDHEMQKRWEGERYWPEQLLAGCILRGDFLRMDWIRASKLHRMALFSISNSVNAEDAWKWFCGGSDNFTFNYFLKGAVREYIRRPSEREKLALTGSLVYTDTGSAKWVDHIAVPSRILSWMQDHRCHGACYTFPDFLALMNTDSAGKTPAGYSEVCNPRDAYSNCWIYYSSILPYNHPWPDRMNTQTWWVKIPSIVLRRFFKEGPDDQRKVRAAAVSMLSEKCVAVRDPETGFWYGWLVEMRRAVDVSGHAISMLIMSGYGVVDISRYWDTVIAMVGQALTSKKDKAYLKLIAEGNLTEDATVNPFELWHTSFDYRAALNAYILLAKDRDFHVDAWTIRMTLKKLKELEMRFPKSKTKTRGKLDARVASLYAAQLQVDQRDTLVK
jgi:hypothetical protein